MQMKSYSIKEINEILSGELVGNTDQQITSPEQLEKAEIHNISFVTNSKYVPLWETSKACAAIVDAKLKIEPAENRAFIKVKNTDIAITKLLKIFDPGPPKFDVDIHPAAVVDKTAIIGKGCKISAGCYIGKNVVLGDSVTLFANVTILDECKVGNGTIFWSGAVIRERTEIGQYCIFNINVSIGADGFGFHPSEDGRSLVKIPQIGNVVIGNGVEVGANTCIDRGKFSSTIIGDGCKIDNLVQIAHNVVLGRSVIVAGTTGIAGSANIGDGVQIAGGVSIKEHIIIHPGAKIGAGSGVMNDIPAGKTFLGYPAQDARETLKGWVVLRKLAKK